MNEKKVPHRRCVGCMESKRKEELTRLAITDFGLMVDPRCRLDGRGIYLCKDSADCFAKALKRKAFERTLKRAVAAEEVAALKMQLGIWDDEPAAECNASEQSGRKAGSEQTSGSKSGQPAKK